MNSWLIATPIWREQPTTAENTFLRITERTNAKAPRWLCSPESLDVSFYKREFPDWELHRFPDKVFRSVTSYSLWLTAPDFYRTIGGFEFVTICQLDAVLIRDITDLDTTGIDYLGAPWSPPLKVLTPGNRVYVASIQERSQGLWLTKKFGRELPVGNGGLSIRRVEAHITAAEWLSKHVPLRYRERTLEDVLLCAFAMRTGLRIAPVSAARRVFLETGAAGLTDVPDVYGFHALWRWNPSLAEALTNGQL